METVSKRLPSASTEEQAPKRPKVTRDLLSNPISKSIDLQNLESSDDHDKISRLKSRINQLDYAFNLAHTKCEAYEIQLKQRAGEYKQELQDLCDKKSDAEARAIYHYKEAESAKKALAMIKMDHNAVSERQRRQLETLQLQNSDLTENLEREKRQRDIAQRSVTTKSSELTSLSNTLQESVDVLKRQVAEQRKTIEEGVDLQSDLSRKLKEAELKLQDLHYAHADAETIKAFDRQLKLQDDTQKMEIENIKLKKELKHYKEMYHDVELLREEKHSLQTRLRDMDKVLEDNLRLDLENTRLKTERLEWSGYLEKADGVDIETPKGIIYNLTKDREQSRLAQGVQSLYKAEIDTRDQIITKLEMHVAELKTALQEKERVHRSDLLTMDLLEKDKQLMCKHVNLLENELKLYDVEEATFMQASYDAQKTHRIRDLEGLLAELEGRMSQHAMNLIQQQMHPTATLTEPDVTAILPSGNAILAFLNQLSHGRQEWEQEKEALLVEIKMQTTTKQLMQQQIQLLESVIERQHITKDAPAPTDEPMQVDATIESEERILSLKANPADTEYSLRKRFMNQLREENAKLLTLVEKYQSAPAGTTLTIEDDATLCIPKVSVQSLKDQVQFLEDAVSKRDKRIVRLQQVFSKKIDQFMEAVTSVLGYRVTTFDEGKVRLESLYAEGSDLSFHITSLHNNHGYIKVVGRRKDDYMDTLQSAYDTFIKQRRSIPGFLSSATLELMDRQVEVYDPTMTHEAQGHDYIEADPLLDSHGHELVDPLPIDQEDELDESFQDEADDSGDNDYVQYDDNDVDGYDDDRLAELDENDDGVLENDPGATESDDDEDARIRHQERSYEATYRAYRYNNDENNETEEDEDDEMEHNDDTPDSSGYNDDEDEVDGDDDDDDGDEDDDDDDAPGTQQEDPIVLDDDSE
ncbi:hypothetical protein DM01DRAFT_1410098 [Hesseltinella vesiculosa]|uniref:Spindle assembly checkpoint component MAD1 n=1 Tax=Hesseltinella vesiculosa TaxID=101127 RepID=A0A1X2G8E0_9FUNG|nr:hypothetical protein DM01DRAFT_1410098 [Hesseltinella vesiculosa]